MEPSRDRGIFASVGAVFITLLVAVAAMAMVYAGGFGEPLQAPPQAAPSHPPPAAQLASAAR
jgi:hypothetical protein